MIKSFLQYLQYEKNYSTHTIKSYETDLIECTDFLVTLNKTFSSPDISHQDIRLWMLHLSEQGNKASSINRKLSALKSFYKFHNAAQTILANPTQKVIAPQKTKPLPAFFQEKDLEKLLEIKKDCCTFEDIRDTLIIEMLYQTGMRSSELISITDQSLDLTNKTIKVHGKGNKERLIPFGDKLKEKINNYIDIRNKEITPQCDSLFTLKSGKPLYPAKLYSIVHQNMSLVSTMFKRSPHVLRHTFATTMLNNGADINAIKAVLGHENLSATQVYTHTTFDKLHNIYEQAHPRANKKRRKK